MLITDIVKPVLSKIAGDLHYRSGQAKIVAIQEFIREPALKQGALEECKLFIVERGCPEEPVVINPVMIGQWGIDFAVTWRKEVKVVDNPTEAVLVAFDFLKVIASERASKDEPGAPIRVLT